MHRKISLRLDADLADRLQLRADRERVPVSYLLRHCVLRLLAGDSQEPSPSKPARRMESPANLKTRAEQLQDEFRQLVCSTFDALMRQGCDSKEAVKQTNLTHVGQLPQCDGQSFPALWEKGALCLTNY